MMSWLWRVAGGVATTLTKKSESGYTKKKEMEGRKQELMNPQTAVRACSSSSSSSSCAVVRIYRAKQTNSKNKWINTHCASAGVWGYVCVCVTEHPNVPVCTRLIYLYVYVGVRVYVCAVLSSSCSRLPRLPLLLLPLLLEWMAVVSVHLWS